YTDELQTSKVYFQKLIDKDPENSAALAYMGKLAYNDENYLRAISYVEKALKYDPENYDYWMDYGTYLRYHGEFDKAAKAWEHATTIEPDYFLAYAYLAGSYDDLEKFDLALKNYHKVIETNPNYYYAYESAAILEYHQKNYAEAIRLFNTAYNYRANDSKLNHLNWAYALMIAASYYKMNNPQGAKKVIATQLKKMDYKSDEYAMVRFFGDTYSRNAENQLKQKIDKQSDSNIKGKMLFYMGLYCEINKADELAKEYYGKVTDMQAPMFFEYRLAEWGFKE
nr:tetratricopeptide repeat protein [Treponema sp.]